MASPDFLSRAEERLVSRLVANRSITRITETTALSPAAMQERSIISPSSMGQPLVDAFREVRTRILAAADGNNIITLVAPVSRGCGGSFIARNLAAAFAFDEAKSAVLIDCDLYQPSQHLTMRINPSKGGVVDYLADQATYVSDMIYETGIPRLRLVPAGVSAKRGTEYFSSFRMKLLVDSLRSRYPDRYVFLDSPPVQGGADARILAELADVVVLVAGYGRDTPAAIAQAAAIFDPTKFAGVVFNEGA